MHLATAKIWAYSEQTLMLTRQGLPFFIPIIFRRLSSPSVVTRSTTIFAKSSFSPPTSLELNVVASHLSSKDFFFSKLAFTLCVDTFFPFERAFCVDNLFARWCDYRADNRAIEREIVCDKNYEQIHYCPPNIYYKNKVKYTLHLHQVVSNSSLNSYHLEWRENLKIGAWFMFTTCRWGLVTSTPPKD